ncbi:hypothetical protein BAMY6639_05185 [Bacillus amyloliquefaciens UMAF6639]|nr:hypothetical protein BAMY6639_05185 [Bacillus amyloliquefaciens UMAF6639]
MIIVQNYCALIGVRFLFFGSIDKEVLNIA